MNIFYVVDVPAVTVVAVVGFSVGVAISCPGIAAVLEASGASVSIPAASHRLFSITIQYVRDSVASRT
ncbi:MAG: hypothetical protein ACUZ8A_10065, partial [Candidatus Bathyanammoxibius sp.]